MKYKKKIKGSTKQQRDQIRKNNIEVQQKGEGLFIFKNRSSFATLELLKKSKDGKKWVGPNETWQGDSYFLKMVPREAILVQTLINPKQETKEDNMSDNKLLLDQPDQVTSDGRVEHFVPNEEQQINEQVPVKSENKKKSKETLLTEDPLAGVTIIRD